MNFIPVVPAATIIRGQYQMASACCEITSALRLLRGGRNPRPAKLAARLRAAQRTLRAAIGAIDQVVEDCVPADRLSVVNTITSAARRA